MRTYNPDRRRFVRDTLCAALGGASVYSALGGMKLLQAATRAGTYGFADYRALVCVFLYGGNDGFNMIVPISGQARTDYLAVRPTLALPTAGLHALNAPASGFGSPGDGSSYGLHASMPELATVFNAGKAAIVANVGTLVQPVTKAEYQNGNPPLPPQLFSHADQSAYWQSSPPNNQPVTGWGGRIADLVVNANPANIPTLTSLGGQDAFLRGQDVNGYVMNWYGPNVVDFPYELSQTNALQNAFNALHAPGQVNALERTYGSSMRHSMATASLIDATLGAAGMPDFSGFFTGTDTLGQQLQTVAKLVWAANNNVPGYTGIQRQVFFVTTDGYDTHSDQLVRQDPLLVDLSRSLAGFHNAMNSVSLASRVTAFTASDFGRSLSNNQNGSDHGWASHHFVVGGAVNGTRFYGDDLGHTGTAHMPSLAPSASNPNDAGYGQIIPTTSVEQYTATLAKWFGLTDGDIDLITPNLANFNTRYLGFVS
ncbi:DUF1501 domain-containing protein [Dokdonella sp.]|uniref:DUF1501 domain-containing protein n=1 Tax=Dokdonella sp. TaxID=2291710 RepID=UPI0037844386